MSIKKKSKIIASLTLAIILIFSLVLSGCDTPPAETSDYFVTFNFNDGVSRPLIKRVEKETAIQQAPSTPQTTGYSFVDWYTAATGGERIEFPFTPTDDVVVYAHWEAGIYPVTFNYNYEGAPSAEVQNIAYMQQVERPAVDPVQPNNTFRNWYTASEGGSVVEFPYTIKKATTFYAQWIPDDAKRYTVDFDLNYENAPPLDSVEYIEGIQAVNTPTTPTRAGHAFVGWFLDDEGDGDPVSFPFVPEADTTLFAKWVVAQYNLTLKNNYGAVDKTNYLILAISGSVETPAPADPVREGYIFNGWWSNARGGTKIEFPQIFSRTATYYAQWIAEEVVTNTFQAEYTKIVDKSYNGYSATVQGTAIIDPDSTGALGAQIDDGYLLADIGVNSYIGYYVTYLYIQGDQLTFEIYSDRAVSNATLSARLTGEIKHFSIAPETDLATNTFSYSFIVNDQPLSYNPIRFEGYSEGGGSAGTFADYTISQISLNEGLNTIVLRTNNTTSFMGGTMYAAAPMVDSISISGTDARLSWHPVYENLGYIG